MAVVLNRLIGLLPSRGSFAFDQSQLAFAGTEGVAGTAIQSIGIVQANPAIGIGTLSVGSITYNTGGTGWAAAVMSGLSSVVTATTGALTAGTHTATMVIDATSAPSQSFTLSFVVAAPLAPSIQISRSIMDFRGVTGATQTTPASDTVTVSNTGGGGALQNLAVVSGQPWAVVTIAGSVITAVPTPENLSAGTSAATYTVSATGAASAQAAITVNVEGAPAVPAANLVPASPSQFTATVGGANPTPQTITITNAGGGTLATCVATVVTGAWLAATPGGSGNAQTLQIAPVTGALTQATYAGQLSLDFPGAAVTPILVNVSFVVGTSAPVAEPVPLAILPTWSTFDTSDGSLDGAPFTPELLSYFS